MAPSPVWSAAQNLRRTDLAHLQSQFFSGQNRERGNEPGPLISKLGKSLLYSRVATRRASDGRRF